MATFPENYQLAQDILKTLAAWYLQQIEVHKDKDPALLVRLMVVALTQYAGVLGVDVGMTEEQFINVCKAQWGEAYKKAPKFG